MSSDLIRCCICFADYDLEKHIPVILSQCGHNICEPCANSLTKSAHPECPICRKSQNSDTKYVPNRQIKEQLERERQYQSCKIHEGRLLEFYCKTDKSKVCVDCCFDKGEQGHKGHEIEKISDLRQEIDSKRKVLEEHLKSCRITHGEVKTIVNKKKQELLYNTKDLERVTRLIALETSLRLRGVIDEEEEKMEKICGQDSEITKKIQDKVTEYKNIKTADLVLLVEENPEEFAKKLDNSKVQEYLQNVNNQIELPATPVIVQNSNQIKIDAPFRLTHLKVNGYLKLDLKEDELLITAGQEFNKNTTLDLIKYDREAKRVKIIFDNFDFNEKDMQVIAYLWARLQPQVDSIDIAYTHSDPKNSAHQEHLIDFPRGIFSQSRTLKSIGLSFNNSLEEDRYVRLLKEKILPQSINLVSLNLALPADSGRLSDLITCLNSQAKGITHLSLSMVAQDKVGVPLLKLPNLKSFKFSIEAFNARKAGGNKVSQNSGNKFLQNSLLAMKSLEECDLKLPNDESQYFATLFLLFFSFSHLKALKISMPNLHMHKSEVDNFIAQIRSQLKNLEVVNVNINYIEPASQGAGKMSRNNGHGSAQPTVTSSVFAQQSSTASSGGLFGSQARSSTSASVFGQQSSTTSSGDFFASQARPAVTSSVSRTLTFDRLFGNQAQPSVNSSVFAQQSSTLSLDRLFGNQARSSESSLLFGPGGLFSSSNNQPNQVTSNADQSQLRVVICYKCKQEGHYSNSCPIRDNNH